VNNKDNPIDPENTVNRDIDGEYAEGHIRMRNEDSGAEVRMQLGEAQLDDEAEGHAFRA